MSLLVDFKDPRLAQLYSQAESYAETATAHLWVYVFLKYAFRGWSQPASVEFLSWGGRKTRNEIVVRRCVTKDGESSKQTVLLWACAPRARKPAVDVQDLELLANITASRYIQLINEGLAAVWIMTAFGPYARLWAYVTQDDRSGHHLWPIFPLGERRAQVSYLDLRGHEPHFQFLFALVQREPNPTSDLVRRIVQGTAEDQLVDVRNATQVSAQRQRGGVVDCRLPDGSVVGVASPWSRAFIIYENQPWSCYQCCSRGKLGGAVRYWTWGFISGVNVGQKEETKT